MKPFFLQLQLQPQPRPCFFMCLLFQFDGLAAAVKCSVSSAGDDEFSTTFFTDISFSDLTGHLS
jgi:hypothetical protein